MILTFPNAGLKTLLAIAEKQWPLEIKTLYDEETGPGFWLVGDEGVYLMQNGKSIGDGRQPLVFAEQCNPEKMDFEDWWENKRASFGGDDGVEFIEADHIRKAVAAKADLEIDLTPQEMKISY